jgi:phosphoheptose isomerase
MNMKIAFVSEHASPLALLGGADAGGQNVYVDKLARYLTTIGYEVDIFTRWDDPTRHEIVELAPGIRVIHVKAGPVRTFPKEELLPHMHEFITNVKKFVHREGTLYDLVHAHFFMSGMVALELKLLFGIPFVITFHALGKVRRVHQRGADGFSDERFAIEERIIREANMIIAECPQDEDDLRTLYGAPKDRITIIPCGFDPQEFYPIEKRFARDQLGFDQHEQIILQLGRMVPRKGIDTVIEALYLLSTTYRKRVRLVIVGGESTLEDSPEVKRLRLLTEKLGLSARVSFMGPQSREKLKYFYNASDVFVSTPWYEPFGITPLEAGACGVPTVASRVGGIKYSIVDGETGILVAPKYPRALAEALQRLLTDGPLYARMKENALRRVEKHFTWDNVARQMDDVYRRVLRIPHEELRDDRRIAKHFEELAHMAVQSRKTLGTPLSEAALLITEKLKKGGKLLTCGNGGSAADAQHMAIELVGHFKADRVGMPAVALSADGVTLTAIMNDFQTCDVFARQVEALGQAGDVVVAFSTSGNSKNVLRALEVARARGIATIGISGKGGGAMRALCDIAIVVPSDDTQIIQEVHTSIVHILCEQIERGVFPPRLISQSRTSVSAFSERI